MYKRQVHAQDHLMTAMAIRDMVEEMVAYAEELARRSVNKQNQRVFLLHTVSKLGLKA